MDETSDIRVALVGYGEAGETFARAARWREAASAFDIKTEGPATRSAKLADYANASVRGCETLAEALDGVSVVLSLVTADAALAAASAAARHLAPGALYCDMNSVAPDTKKAAGRVVEGAGAHYVDVAILAPVMPARLAVPLLLSGAAADRAARALAVLGFTNLHVIGTNVGMASAVKMVRSIMVKGIEALSAECMMAAEAAGVRNEVIASLNESWPGVDWAAKADYNLERMMTHGGRRAAEMEEVARLLKTLDVPDPMTRGTIDWQKAVGSRALAPVSGLAAKLKMLLGIRGRAA